MRGVRKIFSMAGADIRRLKFFLANYLELPYVSSYKRFSQALEEYDSLLEHPAIAHGHSTLDIVLRALKHSAVASVIIENLSKEFKAPGAKSVTAVSQLNLSVPAGELLVLVGPSGSGKSTTLRMIAGLEKITSGTISIDGKIINDVRPGDRDLAMVFQNPALYPHLTVHENLAFGLKVRKIPREEMDRRVKDVVEILNLRDCLDRLPMEISGGQRQRVALGRALVRQSRLILLDEPLSNLDAPLRAQMRREITALHRRLGVTMIYVTHDQVEAMTLGQRIAVLKDGVLQQVAEPIRLYRQPKNMFVAVFIGSPAMNFFRGMVNKDNGSCKFKECGKTGSSGFELKLTEEIAARLSKYTNRNIVLGIRAEHVSLGKEPNGDSIAATVESVEQLGAENFVHTQTQMHRLVIRVSSAEIPALEQRITCQLDLAKAHFFDAETEKVI